MKRGSDYVLSLAVSRDLLAIWSFVAEQAGESVADGLLADFERGFRSFASAPNIGHSRKDVRHPQLLTWTVHRYLIIYKPGGREIEIVRVVHGSRRMEGLIDSASKND